VTLIIKYGGKKTNLLPHYFYIRRYKEKIMEKTTLIKVLNRDNGSVVYSIPEMNGLRRVYQSGEIKEITFEELEKLSYIPGGMELLEDSLVILDNK
jgi:hypothetical protein